LFFDDLHTLTMLGTSPFLVLCLLAGHRALPIDDVIPPGVRGALEGLEWSDFRLQYSRGVQPVVTYGCALLDYLRMFQPDLQPQSVAQLAHSVCADLPMEARLDFSYLEGCVLNGSCVVTDRTHVVLGLSHTSQLYGSFNMTVVPKRTVVHNCLAGESCQFKEEAEKLEADWTRTVENCHQLEAEEALGAIENARPEADAAEESELMYSRALTKCLTLTSNSAVRSAAVRALRRTYVCSEEVVVDLERYLEAHPTDPVLNGMQVFDKLMGCEGLDMRGLEILGNFLQSQPQSQTGAGIWQSLKNYEEDERLLRRRRSSAVSDRVQTLVRDSRLQDKWEHNPFVRQFSYLQPTVSGAQLYRATIMTNGFFSNPLMIKFSQKNTHFDIENSVTLLVESPLMADIAELLATNGDNLNQQLSQLAAKLMQYPNALPPVKVSLVMTSDRLDVTDRHLVALWHQISAQLQTLRSEMQQQLGNYWITVSRIGGTDMAARFDLKMNPSVDDPSTMHWMNMTMSVTGAEGQTVASLDLQTSVADTLPVADQDSVSLTGGRVQVTGTGYCGPLSPQRYSLEAFYEPYISFEDAATRCEAAFAVKDESGTIVAHMDSCSRPVYLLDSDKYLDQVVSVTKVFSVDDLLRLNVTLDMGENGLFGFIASPKSLVLELDVHDRPVVKLQVDLQPLSVWGLEDKVKPIFWVKTTGRFECPMLQSYASVVVNTKIYGDESSTNEISFYSDVTEEATRDVSDAIFRTESCYPIEESMITSLLATGTFQFPKTWCYITTLRCPMQDILVEGRLEKREGRSVYDSTLAYLVDGHNILTADLQFSQSGLSLRSYPPLGDGAVLLLGEYADEWEDDNTTAAFVWSYDQILMKIPASHDCMLKLLGTDSSPEFLLFLKRGSVDLPEMNRYERMWEYTLVCGQNYGVNECVTKTPYFQIASASIPEEKKCQIQAYITPAGDRWYHVAKDCADMSCEVLVEEVRLQPRRSTPLLLAKCSPEAASLSLNNANEGGMCEAFRLDKNTREHAYDTSCLEEVAGYLKYMKQQLRVLIGQIQSSSYFEQLAGAYGEAEFDVQMIKSLFPDMVAYVEQVIG
jgi:hypothetical protein